MATKAKHYASEGARSLTPHLTVKGAKQAIEFYKRAFGAVVKGVSEDPSGLVLHSQLMIGDSLLFLNDEFPAMGAKGPLTLGGTPVTIHLFVPDADKTFDTAVAAGAKVAMPMGDQFWGDRYGMVIDPFGHSWSISTHLEDLTPDEIMERMKKAKDLKADQKRDVVNRQCCQGTKEAHGDDRAPGAGHGITRQDQRRETRRMNRVDLAVPAANEVIGAKVAAPERAIVAAGVVVLDLQVAIDQQTVGDDQIVWFVAARTDARKRPQPEPDVKRQADDEDGHAPA